MNLFYVHSSQYATKITKPKYIRQVHKWNSNEKLRFEVTKVGTTRFVDSAVVTVPRYLVFIDSVNTNSLSELDKHKLIKRLMPLLNDSTKDWYANVLLYQLTEKEDLF